LVLRSFCGLPAGSNSAGDQRNPGCVIDDATGILLLFTHGWHAKELFHVEQKRVDPGQPLPMLVVVMKNKNKKAPDAAKASELVLTPETVVSVGGGYTHTLVLSSKADTERYEVLREKYPNVHKSLSDVSRGVYEIADQSRKLVMEILATDMKHEDSKLMLSAWGYGKDRISMIHRIVDAAPKTQEAYLKGDFGLKRAVLEARAEDGEPGSDNGRGGKRGAKKQGGNKEQREELFALADELASKITAWKASKNNIKTEWVRHGSDPWEVKIEVRYKALAQPGVEDEPSTGDTES